MSRWGRSTDPRPVRETPRPERRALPYSLPVRRSGARGEARAPERRSMQARLDAAVLDVAVHRAVSYRDLADRVFDGHPFAARRGVDRLVREGFVREARATGPKGGAFTVLHPTKQGAAAARAIARDAGLDEGQRAWRDAGRSGDLVHDTGVYRATRDHRAGIEEARGQVTRIRLDAELRGIVAKRSEAARIRGGRDAADRARIEAARELHLPVLETGQVLYPDAQLEYSDARGEMGRVNIEIATEHYKPGSIAAKAAAGFAIHASGGSGARAAVLAGLRLAGLAGRAAQDGGGGGRGGRDDPDLLEL